MTILIVKTLSPSGTGWTCHRVSHIRFAVLSSGIGSPVIAAQAIALTLEECKVRLEDQLGALHVRVVPWLAFHQHHSRIWHGLPIPAQSYDCACTGGHHMPITPPVLRQDDVRRLLCTCTAAEQRGWSKEHWLFLQAGVPLWADCT